MASKGPSTYLNGHPEIFSEQLQGDMRMMLFIFWSMVPYMMLFPFNTMVKHDAHQD